MTSTNPEEDLATENSTEIMKLNS
uniref:Uncharacterized protein n=1 Tax=Arundo donax TaxID=35708 RepID=A0A0A9CHH6_ARUDO